MNHPTEQRASFTPSTRALFLQHLRENPHNRRVTQTNKELLTEWLTDPHKQPLSQKEFSRRNYVLRTFLWDEQAQNILVSAKTEGEKHRLVVTEDKIADVVEFVHESNKHGGWDATWKDISNSQTPRPLIRLGISLLQAAFDSYESEEAIEAASSTFLYNVRSDDESYSGRDNTPLNVDNTTASGSPFPTTSLKPSTLASTSSGTGGRFPYSFSGCTTTCARPADLRRQMLKHTSRPKQFDCRTH
ncbi:MAG: hypothetical protein Q9173_000919 [Seirophora scorigena]